MMHSASPHQPPAAPPSRGGRRVWQALLLLAVLAALALAVLLWRGQQVPRSAGDDAAAGVAPSAAVLERGAYLVRIGACMGCHTAVGGPVLAGGGEVRTPFGVFHAPNLTPHEATGLGRWSVDDFRQAMRHGVAPGGRLLYPAFPYEQYTLMRTDDVDAIYHYLRSLPAVERAAQPHALDFPYGSQLALALWRGLYFRTTPPAAQAAGVPEPVVRGRYLVQAVAHCAACHSPRNGLGALGGGQRLEGGLMSAEGWSAPSLLDSREAGVQRWPLPDIARLLQTGGAQGGATASGPMADAVFWSTQYLSDADALAVAQYLRLLPDAATTTVIAVKAGASAADTGANAAGVSKAQGLYRLHCAACHGEQGQGKAGVWPPLAGNRAVLRTDAGNLLRSVLQGGYSPATAGQPAPSGMPPFMQTLSDEEIASLTTYIRRSWGNDAPAVATMEVFRARQGRP